MTQLTGRREAPILDRGDRRMPASSASWIWRTSATLSPDPADPHYDALTQSISTFSPYARVRTMRRRWWRANAIGEKTRSIIPATPVLAWRRLDFPQWLVDRSFLQPSSKYLRGQQGTPSPHR
jgi:hypothetical protein